MADVLDTLLTLGISETRLYIDVDLQKPLRAMPSKTEREMSSICRSSVDSNAVSEVDDRCCGQWMDGLVKGATSACVVRDRMVVINCGILSRAAADFGSRYWCVPSSNVLRPEKLGVNFEHFWLVVTNKCYNIDFGILINDGTLALRVANWLPNGVSLFQPWGQYKAIKFSIYYVAWGRFKICFSISAFILV
jgi:hypothetical protein